MTPQALAAICWIVGALGVAAGVGLLLVPTRTLRERTRIRRWLLEIDLLALLDRRQTIEPPLYRYHRRFGAAVILGAVAWLATLWGLGDQPLLTAQLADTLGRRWLRAVILSSWALAVFALGIGVFVLIRPSLLKGLETVANRWFEPFPPANQRVFPAEEELIGRAVLRAPRLVGLLLLAAGLGYFLIPA